MENKHGYLVSHPELPNTFSVTLSNSQADEVRNALSEIGNGGGKVVRMSDLTSSITFERLIAFLHTQY